MRAIGFFSQVRSFFKKPQRLISNISIHSSSLNMNIRLASLLLDSDLEQWKLFYDYYVEKTKEAFPDDDLLPFEIVKQSYSSQLRDPEKITEIWLVIDSSQEIERCVGCATLSTFRKESPSYKGNEKLVIGTIDLLSNHFKTPSENALVKKTIEFMETLGKEILVLIGGSTRDSKDFFRRLGAKIALSGAENRLYLDNVDWKLVEEWIQNGEQAAIQYGSVLKVFTRVPDEVIETFAETYTETYNEQPMGELDVSTFKFGPEQIRRNEEEISQLGGIKYTAIILEKDGMVSGLTELIVHPDIPFKAYQGLTGVRKQFRGRGYGKWLKAFLLRKTKQSHPKLKYITTGNASTNAPMMSINQRLGFKRYRESHEAQITLQSLRDFAKLSNMEFQ